MKFSEAMASARNKILESGIFYNLLQWLVGSANARRYFVSKFVATEPGARVLEIGCGPGTLVPFLGADLAQYVGYEPNPQYIEAAQRRFPDVRYKFVCGKTADATSDLAGEKGTFDVVISAAVLHHLDDQEALDLLRLASFVCGEKGHFASYDNAFVENQNPIARRLIAADRGQFVRTPQAYEALVRQAFRKVEMDIRHDLFSVPYTLIFFRASNEPETAA